MQVRWLYAVILLGWLLILIVLLTSCGELTVSCACTDGQLGGVMIEQHSGWNGGPRLDGSFDDVVEICRRACEGGPNGPRSSH
jgi:hypothetical protein